ncbi:DUF2935 domain-containing protein [Paenibacillus aestuarii]|uniref:DUF2935 domain-containing protein n=1 Tax=Paenibacillus aestuarii TaxID=516965 RepID=A0ABW0KGN5_9BACL|nr:DUF2935 domain-containing protein [Paenibacillus aestuarii]
MEFTLDYEEPALDELRFWLQVLGDHARFIHHALTSDEGEEMERARCFIQTLDHLLEVAQGNPGTAALTSLNRQSYLKAQELRAFKLHLLERHVTGTIGLNLPPAFLNHMVNEAEEALRVMGFLLNHEVPPSPSPLQLHLLWLQDAYGHAAAIEDNLDLTEHRRKEMSRHFIVQFKDFYIKAVEFAQFLRTNVQQFPALSRLNKEADLEMTLFIEFLRELEEQCLTYETLGTLTPLMADHMLREELYYLKKLSQVAGTRKPSSQAKAPRIEN